jgi:hypothetical protein
MEQIFGDSSRLSQFARPTESQHLLEKVVLSPARRGLNRRESGLAASSTEEIETHARTTRNSRNLDRQENEALGDDWTASVC